MTKLVLLTLCVMAAGCSKQDHDAEFMKKYNSDSKAKSLKQYLSKAR